MIDAYFNFGFAHYGLMMVLAFVCFYVSCYLIGREHWDWVLFLCSVILSAFASTGWPAFFTLWLIGALALGPCRFIFRWVEDLVDSFIDRSDNKKHDKRKVHA